MTLLATAATIFVGCKKDDEKDPTYLVQVAATEGGSIEGQNGEYKEGETVVFTAVPADGYYFSQWSDGKTDNPRTINVSTSDITLEAQFAQNALITITAGSNGTVGGSDNGRYAQGETLTFTAIPATGYCFSQWSDGNIDNPRTIKVGKDDISLTAEFAEQTIATVDLGLPSGNLWATCNVGAINPWDYGDYYAWGETQTKDKYIWGNYKYSYGSYSWLKKYNNNADYGTVDNKTTLESADDVANAVFGANYSMPTTADWSELCSQCYWVWTADYNNRGVSGYVVYRAKADADKGTGVFKYGTQSASYSLSDAHIFLPAAGNRIDDNHYNYAGSQGYYWSALLYTDNYPSIAWMLWFSSDGVGAHSSHDRYIGQSVRPVRRP